MSPVTIELTAPDISCQKCQTNVESGLAREPGVEDASVDVGARHIRIAYDHEQTSPSQLRSKLSEIGYPAAP